MQRRKIVVLGSLILTVAVLIMIWCFSAQSATESSSLSDGLAQFVSNWLGISIPLGQLVHLLRKLAHFTIYLALGCGLTGMLLYQRAFPVPLAVLVSGAVFAAADEIHQIFVPGRGPSVFDVMLDTCGVLVGMLLVFAARSLWRKFLAHRAA